MTYKEYKDKEQKDFNALPIFWAFGKEQFRTALQERGLTEKDTDQVYSLGGGGYYLKRDAEVIAIYMLGAQERNDRFRELMNDPKFAEDAFYYEMGNHEYHINWQGDWDVTNCFGSAEYEEGAGGLTYLKRMGYPIEVLQAYERARARFLRDAGENDWY